jgi:hypothetical protein
MLRFILLAILTGGLGAVTSLFFPWWSLVLVAFILGAIIPLKWGVSAFFGGFLGGGLYWGLAILVLSYRNGGILADRIGELLGGLGGPGLIVSATALAGILSGLAALTGYLARQLFVKPAKTNPKEAETEAEVSA